MATNNYKLIKKLPARTISCEDTRLKEQELEEFEFEVE
jgi:cell division transport system ATP-binding protein